MTEEEIYNRIEEIENSIAESQQKVISETASADEVIQVITGLKEIKELRERQKLLNN